MYFKYVHDTSITSIGEYSFPYVIYLVYAFCTLSGGVGELEIYALYVIELLIGNIGLVLGNIIVL